jgi:NADPH:quinone reductase-like Zn-dependent oxidoreductase/thioesterase domain-containing protein/acyl carrier protein
MHADGSIASFRVEMETPGILANLTLHEAARPAPAADEIEVRVRAAGINFRDVMKALGTHPGNPIDARWFGDDFAGVVERVGRNVEGFAPGDDVAGMAPYAFRSYVTADPRLVFKKPASLSFEDAATIPTAFLTAHYALVHLARLRAGERVLIHAAAGGVGLAAMQIARRLSLEIFATAGTPEKRELLESLGATHVMSSRTLEFADEIMRTTSGRGVDAVLNSLAGDFIPKSMSVLAPFGRFLEIGKVDIYRNAKIALQPLRQNISYFVIDLLQHLVERPASVASLFAELAAAFARGDYQPLPRTVFPVTDVAEAFRFMAQSKHVGKNVLTFDVPAIPIQPSTDRRSRFRRDATYLITGGASGFGLEVAKWIGESGARHLVLMSRSGPRDEEARQAIDGLRQRGITVIDARADVTRADAVHRVVDEITATLPPLAGVFHAAMVLDDDLITELDAARFEHALEPKMAGAWNLHRATESLDLDYFVCFSSFSSIVAMPRQASYNAGNAFLDALAHYRHARGLPALTVNWGAIRGAGFIERTARTRDFFDKIGLGAFQVPEALHALDLLITREPVQALAARADWRAVARFSPLVAASRMFAGVTTEDRTEERSGSLVSRVRAAAADARAPLVEEFIAAQVAGVFGMSAQRIDRDAPLTSLGLDSLMTVELTNRIERELGLRIPMGSLLAGPNLAELSRIVLRLMAPALDEEPTPNFHADTTGRLPREPRVDPLVLLRAGNGEPPLFVFHPVGGGVAIYGALASRLTNSVPVFGVESSLMQGADRERSDLEEMIDAYASAVGAAHAGPYRLFGFSLGGYLAARVADRLERRGRDVEFVGSVEWNARRAATPAAQRESLIELSVASYLFVARETGLVRILPDAELRREMAGVVDRVMQTDSGGGDIFFRWVVDRKLTTTANADFALEYLSRFEQHCRLLTRELPRPRFRAPLLVWRAQDGFGSRADGWDHAGMTIDHVLQGDHLAWTREPALTSLACQLDTVLVNGFAAATPTGIPDRG